jgi:hypothetical protein
VATAASSETWLRNRVYEPLYLYLLMSIRIRYILLLLITMQSVPSFHFRFYLHKTSLTSMTIASRLKEKCRSASSCVDRAFLRMLTPKHRTTQRSGPKKIKITSPGNQNQLFYGKSKLTAAASLHIKHKHSAADMRMNKRTTPGIPTWSPTVVLNKRTTPGIPTWSPTVVLTWPDSA